MKGIRHSNARDADPASLTIPGGAPEGLSAEPVFRAGVVRLGERGLVFDSWHYHHQNQDFAELAAAVPGTTMVLDHFGTPIGVRRFAGKLDRFSVSYRLLWNALKSVAARYTAEERDQLFFGIAERVYGL